MMKTRVSRALRNRDATRTREFDTAATLRNRAVQMGELTCST